jgi:hypothetical protein
LAATFFLGAGFVAGCLAFDLVAIVLIHYGLTRRRNNGFSAGVAGIMRPEWRNAN